MTAHLSSPSSSSGAARPLRGIAPNIQKITPEGGIDDWTSQNFRTQPTEDPDEDTELGAG